VHVNTIKQSSSKSFKLQNQLKTTQKGKYHALSNRTSISDFPMVYSQRAILSFNRRVSNVFVLHSVENKIYAWLVCLQL